MIVDELLESALKNYRSALLAMGRCGVQAVPAIGAGLQQALQGIEADLAPTSSSLEGAGKDVEQELTSWGECAAQYNKDKTAEVREIIFAMARTTEAMGESDQRYAKRLQEFTGGLESLTGLDDLSQIRQWVVRNSMELRKTAAELTQASQDAIDALRAEVARYETLLTESERRATHDPLTGLYNRRGIERELDRRVKVGRSFCVLIFDLNKFKAINDTYGHIAGDEILKQFAVELKANFRQTDAIGRFGGDEFIIVMDSGIDEANATLVRVGRWIFGRYRIQYGAGEHQVNVTAATGTAAWDRDETISSLLLRADQCMYRQKIDRKGR